MDSSVAETSTDLPLMKFIDKTERSVSVISVDSNYTFWIRFVHDSINVFINHNIFIIIILVY